MRAVFLKYASDEQLDYVSPIDRMLVETFNASFYVFALENRRQPCPHPPERISAIKEPGRSS